MMMLAVGTLFAAVIPSTRAGTLDTFTKSTSLLSSGNYSNGTPNNGSDVNVTSTTTGGGLTITAGSVAMESLSISNARNYSISNATSVATNSTLTLGNTGTPGFTNVNSGVASDLIYVGGTATLYLYGPNSSGASGTGTLGVTLASNGNFDITSTNTSYYGLEVNATISGAYGITKTGGGSLLFDTVNTFTGAFGASAGTTLLGGNSVLGSVSAVNLSGSAVVFDSVLSLSNVINSTAPVSLSGTSSLQTQGSAQTVASITGVVGTALYVGDYTSTASPPVTTAGSFTVGDNTSTTFAGAIVDAHAGTGAGFTKQGSGTLTLTGNNTLFTSPVAITGGTLAAAATGTDKALGAIKSVAISNGGTLLLGNSDQVNAAATMTLGSATGSGTAKFNAAGFNQGTTSTVGLGALTLTATAAIDFGAGNGGNFLHFANSGSTTWTSGSILYISDYTGSVMQQDGSTVAGTTTDALLFGSDNTGLNTTQITQVEFVNPSGYTGTFGASIDNTGMVIADVPEPTTILGGLLLVGVAGWSQRRRVRVFFGCYRGLAA